MLPLGEKYKALNWLFSRPLLDPCWTLALTTMSVNVEPQLNHSPPSESSLTQTASENTGIRQGGKSTPPEVEQTSLEDDWYSNPANARNWSFVQKWTAMLIVNASGFWHPIFKLKYSFFFFLAGIVIHISCSTGQCNDGTWFAGDCNQVCDNKFLHRSSEFEYLCAWFRHWCQYYSTSVFIFRPQPLLTGLTTAPFSCSSIRNVWTNLGEHHSDFITYLFFHTTFLPDPPHRQCLEPGFQSGLCIFPNGRRPNRIPFIVYVYILSFF